MHAIGQSFIVVNGQNWKRNLTIWSHWWTMRSDEEMTLYCPLSPHTRRQRLETFFPFLRFKIFLSITPRHLHQPNKNVKIFFVQPHSHPHPRTHKSAHILWLQLLRHWQCHTCKAHTRQTMCPVALTDCIFFVQPHSHTHPHKIKHKKLLFPTKSGRQSEMISRSQFVPTSPCAIWNKRVTICFWSFSRIILFSLGRFYRFTESIKYFETGSVSRQKKSSLHSQFLFGHKELDLSCKIWSKFALL